MEADFDLEGRLQVSNNEIGISRGILTISWKLYQRARTIFEFSNRRSLRDYQNAQALGTLIQEDKAKPLVTIPLARPLHPPNR